MTNHLFSLFRSRMPAGHRTFIETPGIETPGIETPGIETPARGASLDYAGVLALSGRLAALLAARGVRPGDRVAAQVEKSAEAVAFYLACVRAGAVYLPLNPAYTLAELDYFIGDAEPAAVVCTPGTEDDIVSLARRHGVAMLETLGSLGEGSLMTAAQDVSPDFPDVPRGPDDLAALLYTSGTTGRSKGAMLTHGNLASNALVLAEAWRFTDLDVLLHALPIFHTHGLFVAINVTLVAGASAIFLSRFDAEELLRLMDRATVMMGVPTFYVRLLGHPGLDRNATRPMRLFVSGSAPLLPDTHEQWYARTGHRIVERYGMTETNMNTSNPFDGDRRAGTVGFPLPGVELRITDPANGQPLAAGEVGVIEVRGPNVFTGYWRMPDKTAAEFRADGFFVTGDLGLIDDRGYVHIVGRGKDLVITGGYNVYPKEVEGEIDALPGVVESAVIGLPHPDFGEGVTAIVVKRPGSTVDERAILKALEGRLAKYKQPKRILFADELPRNAMGKVQKNLLREQHRNLYAAG